MANVKFKFVFDRKHKANNKNKGVVEIRLTYNYKQKFVSTGISVFPNQWDSNNECVKGAFEAPQYNEILQSMKIKIFKSLSSMVDSGEIDLNELVMSVKRKEIDMTFWEYIEMRSEQRQVADGTRAHYKTFLTALKSFGGIILFSDINESAVRKYDEFLRNKSVDRKQSTIYDYHKNLKSFINDAIADGYLKDNPYSSKRIKIERGGKSKVDSLTESKISQLRDLPLGDMLGKVRDLFVFQCYTGLAYVDMQKFDISAFKEIEGGLLFGSGLRTKTGTEYSLVLLPQAIEVLNRYNNKLPKISNQKYNAYLKVIGVMIDEPNLHSHAARGSFASLMLNHGVPIDVLQRMVGHKDRKQTQRYATLRDEIVINGFKSVMEDLK